MISKVRELDYSQIRTYIDQLCITNMFLDGDPVKLMKQIVPEYISKNSELSKFDSLKSTMINLENDKQEKKVLQ